MSACTGTCAAPAIYISAGYNSCQLYMKVRVPSVRGCCTYVYIDHVVVRVFILVLRAPEIQKLENLFMFEQFTPERAKLYWHFVMDVPIELVSRLFKLQHLGTFAVTGSAALHTPHNAIYNCMLSLSACPSPCLPIFLDTCLQYLSLCVPASLPTGLPAWLSYCLMPSTGKSLCLSARLSACMALHVHVSRLPVGMTVSLPALLPACSLADRLSQADIDGHGHQTPFMMNSDASASTFIQAPCSC